MDRKSFIQNMALLLGVVACSVAGTLLCVQKMWLLALFIGLLLLCLVWFSLKQHRNHVRKLKFLIDAIGNNDYMFSFGLSKDRYVNEQLNQIKSMLEKARNEAVEREKYYELILDQVDSGVLVVNDRNNVLLANASLKHLFGVDQLAHLDNLSYYFPGLSEVFAQIQVDCPQTFSLVNEKSTVNISIRLSVLNKQGEQWKVYAVHNILDALNQNELESWNKLSRVLTHEIMNSLAPVISLSETLKERGGVVDPQVVEGLDAILVTSKALVKFVESYRQLTHLPKPMKQPVSVAGIVGKVVTLFEAKSCPKIEFRVNVEPNDLLFYVDERLVLLLLTNLIKNGVEAIGNDAGVIRISAWSDGYENVVLSVSDNGCCISRESVDQIFVPFFTTKKEGSGIGLSLARQIMRLHNGVISLRQNSEEKSFVLVFK